MNRLLVSAAAFVAVAGAAQAANVVLNPFSDGVHGTGATTVANARLRTAANSWDMRLAPNSNPQASDPASWTQELSNSGLGGTFSFMLSHNAALDTLTFEAARTAGGSPVSGSLTLNFSSSFNQIQLQSQSDTGGANTFGAFSFTGLSLSNPGDIALDTVGSMQSLDYLLSTGVDLSSFDWAISGSVIWSDVGGQERPVFNIRLQQTDLVATIIPTPLAGGMGLIGLGLVGARRRRA
jgi:hypothetical protein